MVEPALTMKDRDVQLVVIRESINRERTVQQMGGGECVHSVCTEWDLLHVGLTCLQDYVIQLWNNNHFSHFSSQFTLQYDRLI